MGGYTTGDVEVTAKNGFKPARIYNDNIDDALYSDINIHIDTQAGERIKNNNDVDNSDSIESLIKNVLEAGSEENNIRNNGDTPKRTENKNEYEDASYPESLTDNNNKNITDPIVLHDSGMDQPVIVRSYEPQNKYLNDGGDIGTFEGTHSIMVDGISYPLIQINNQVIEYWQIAEFRLISEGLIPELVLKINDTGRFEEKNGATQANNEIKVILIPKSQKTYKPIKLKFIIDYVEYGHKYTTFYTHFKFLKFNQTHTKMITFPGCLSCPQPANDYLNTWELCHQIATETSLGFFATLHTKEIEDRIGRYMLTESYKDVLIKHNEWAGLDEDSVLDIWIDFYGNINLINLSWVLSQDISPSDLSIIADIGFHSKTNETIDVKTVVTNRIITNFNMLGANNNLMIEDYETNVDNDGFNRGSLDKIISYMFEDHDEAKPLEQNNLKIENVEIIQNTVDGSHTEEYVTENLAELIVEPDNVLHNKQRLIKAKFLQKRRQKTMKIKMRIPNYGIFKGILIYIVITENDPINKQRILTSEKNVYGETDNEKMEKVQFPNGITARDIIQNDSVSLANEYLSGLYFVDAVEYRFDIDNENGEIEQYLTVYKQKQDNGYSNKHTEVRVDYDAFQNTMQDITEENVYIENLDGTITISEKNTVENIIANNSSELSDIETVTNNTNSLSNENF